jgi:histidine ammonia-lyase
VIVTLLLRDRNDFTLENFRRVAWQGEAVEFGEEALQAMAEARRRFEALIAEDRDLVIYGVTSGFGDGAGTQLDDEGRTRQAKLPPYHRGLALGESLPDRVIRGMVFARLTNFIEGHAAVRPQFAERLAAILDGRTLPRLPLRGSMSSGEVDQLTTLYHELVGPDCEIGEAGVLMNGSPCSSALAADLALCADRRLRLMEKVLALSIEAYNAPLDAYDPALATLWGPAEAAALDGLNRHLQGAEAKGRRAHQAPVSWRIVPRVLAQTHRATGSLRDAAAEALKSITDSPVYLPPDDRHPKGRVLSNGGFHNGTTYPAIDGLAQAWADVTGLTSRQVGKLLDPQVLKSPAAADSGVNPSGIRHFATLHVWFRQAAQEEARPTFMPLDEAGSYQTDLLLPTFRAYDKAVKVGRNLDSCLAILAAAASQVLWHAGRQPAPGLREFLAGIRQRFQPVTTPRDLGRDCEDLATAFSGGALSA